MLHKFYNRDFRTNRGVHIGKFHSDGTCTDDNHTFGLFFQNHCFAVVDYFFTIDWHVGQTFGPTTSGNNDVLCTVLGFGALGIRYLYLFVRCQNAISVDDSDFIFFHQKIDPLAHAIGHTPTTLYDAFPICFGAANLDAIIFCMLNVFKNLGTFDECFGGNATPVEAYPAQ